MSPKKYFVTADISHPATTGGGVLFQYSVLFGIERTRNIGLFWPNLDTSSQIYPLFGVLLTGLNNPVVYRKL